MAFKYIVAGLSLLLVSIAPSYGHSPMQETVPANGATLAKAPEEIKLHFAGPVRITKATLVHDSGGNQKETDLNIPNRDLVNNIAFNPSFSGTGKYQVQWRALAKDGHPMKGSFSFSISDN